MTTMNEERAISDLLTTLLHAIDRVDWQKVRACFDESLHLDYTSLEGGTPGRISADEVIQKWQAVLPGFDATQHVTGGIIVSALERSASAETHVRGYHYLPGDADGKLWMVAGHYQVQFEKRAAFWKITGLTLKLFYQDGNLALPKLAAQKAGKTPRIYS